MPRAVRPLSQWSIIADLRRDVDRLRLRSPSQQVIFTHDTFTAAGTPSTTYPLTYLPTDGSVLLAKQGLVLREGTDYTVDGTTGIVTVTASQTAGDQIVFRYATTGELIANNATVETDAITDNFNRADSALTINPASDGSTWSSSDGVDGLSRFGITSNRGYLAAATDTGGQSSGTTVGRVANIYYAALQDLGKAAADVHMTWYRTGTGSPFGCICIAQDLGSVTSVTGDGYQLTFDGSATVTLRGVHANANTGHVVGTWTVTPWTTGGSLLRVTFDGTSTFELFQGGVSKGTLTDGVGGLTLGTWVGWGTQGTGKDTVDDFSAS